MTKTQARLLEYIRSYIAEHGYSPSIDEMAEGIGVWYTTAFIALKRLNERGIVVKGRGWRSVRIPDGGANARAA
jgi:SOS-response transcriptional repressor LexA